MLSLVDTSSESVSQNLSELEGEKESIDWMLHLSQDLIGTNKVTGAPTTYEAEDAWDYQRHFESVDSFRVFGDGNEYETTGFIFQT